MLAACDGCVRNYLAAVPLWRCWHAAPPCVTPPPPLCTRRVQGTDKLTEAVLQAHQVPGDMFEVYCLKNILDIPDKYRDAVRAKLEIAGSARSGKVYTAKQQEEADARIAALEAAILKVRLRGRGMRAACC